MLAIRSLSARPQARRLLRLPESGENKVVPRLMGDGKFNDREWLIKVNYLLQFRMALKSFGNYLVLVCGALTNKQ